MRLGKASGGRIEDRTGLPPYVPSTADRFLHLLGKALGTRSGDLPTDEEIRQQNEHYNRVQKERNSPGPKWQDYTPPAAKATMRVSKAQIDATARKHDAEARAGKVRSTWGSKESMDYMNRGYLEKVADWVTRGL